MTSYQYRKSHCGDKTIWRPSYLHNGISYTGKMISLYWIRAQETEILIKLANALCRSLDNTGSGFIKIWSNWLQPYSTAAHQYHIIKAGNIQKLQGYFSCHLKINVAWHMVTAVLTCGVMFAETWCQDMEKLPTLLALCEGNPPVTGGFPSQRVSSGELWGLPC